MAAQPIDPKNFKGKILSSPLFEEDEHEDELTPEQADDIVRRAKEAEKRGFMGFEASKALIERFKNA